MLLQQVSYRWWLTCFYLCLSIGWFLIQHRVINSENTISGALLSACFKYIYKIHPQALMMAKRKMSLNELSEKVGLTLSNLSILKTGKAKAIRFSTLEAICEALQCQPGDILEYTEERK